MSKVYRNITRPFVDPESIVQLNKRPCYIASSSTETRGDYPPPIAANLAYSTPRYLILHASVAGPLGQSQVAIERADQHARLPCRDSMIDCLD